MTMFLKIKKNVINNKEDAEILSTSQVICPEIIDLNHVRRLRLTENFT